MFLVQIVQDALRAGSRRCASSKSSRVFKQHPIDIGTVMRSVLRNQGLETPLLQRRLVNAWDEVIREIYDQKLAEYIIENTEQKDIRNQTLWVKIASPAIRADLQMKNSDLAATLNNKIGTQVITNIRLY